MSETSRAQATVLLTHEAGLHARPSVSLTKRAKQFRARIQLALAPDGPWVDAKSIVKIMATKAPQGSTLHLRAEGEDADTAIHELVALVERDFEDHG